MDVKSVGLVAFVVSLGMVGIVIAIVMAVLGNFAALPANTISTQIVNETIDGTLGREGDCLALNKFIFQWIAFENLKIL